MEVPGKKLQQTASAIDDNCCQHCCQDGESAQAEGYCTSFKKALCSTCVITHKKEIQSQRICGQSIILTSIGDKSYDEESYKLCEKHPNEFIKLFSSSHDSPVCGHCLAFNHRSCNVSLISELCNFESGSVNKDIVDFLTDVDEYPSKIKINMNFVTKQSKAEVLKLREYRINIEVYLEQRMCFLLEEIQHMKSMDETLLDSLKPKCDHVKSKAETLKFRLSLLENNPAKLFIETKRAQTELAELRSTLADMNKEKIIHEYRFEKDSCTEKLLASKTGLDQIKEKHESPREKQPHGNELEIPGKMFQSTESAIDEKCCKPCCDDGESVQAEAYCTSCKKGLCATCVIAHRKQMRSHRIFDKIYDEESYEQCERHPKEFIKYYCPKHDSLICGHCSVLEHGSCKVEIISELCKSDYESINDDNADLLTNSDGSASKIENNMDLITEKDKTEELLASQIDLGTMKEKHVVPRKKQLFGNEIEVLEVPGKKLQSTESAIDENADLLSNSDGSASKIENNMDLLTEKDTTEELIASEIDLGTMKEKHVVPRKEQLFGNEMEVPGKKLQSTESAIDENADLLTNNDGSASKIENNMDLLTEKDTNEELIASEIELGTMKEKHVVPRKKQLFASCITKELVLVGIVGIVVIGIIVQVVVINKGDYTPVDLTSLRYTRAPDIQVNGSTREILLLPENRLLIADWGNKTSIIEMLDLLNNNLMFEVSLPSRPRSMCILPEERLAVSLPGIERIQFLNTLGELSLDGNIKVDGECLGIGYHNDKLIVSYRGGKVEVMDMTGKVIKMIDKDDSGQAIFHIPLYLYVVSEAQTAVIYVSDFGKSTITKLDMDLKTLQTFQDPALTEPTGITEVGNQLLICGHDSNNIMVLDLSSGKMTQLLGEVEGFVRPLSVCYIHKQNKMYVSLAIKSPIIVYKVDPN